MWSDWLVFCDCGLHSACPLMERDKRLMEASWWERWLRGKPGLILMGGAMFSKSLIGFFVTGWGCVPSLLFGLRPNYGGGNEKVPCTHCCTQCPQPCSRPPPTHASARDSWTLTGKSGSVSCEVTAPFSWVLVHISFCLCPPRECFPCPV